MSDFKGLMLAESGREIASYCSFRISNSKLESDRRLKFNIMKDTLTRESLFTRVREAIENKDYQTASDLQIELKRSMEEIQQLYMQYKKNIY